MAGSVRLLIPLLLFAASVVYAGESRDERSHKHQRPRGDAVSSPELDNVRRAIDALTPEQRKRFQENFWRWTNLSPEEKKALRDRDEMRRKFIRDEVDAAIKESGLALSDERKVEFSRRYSVERRKIEERLREEMTAKRKPLVRELLSKLTAEFNAPESAASPAQPKP